MATQKRFLSKYGLDANSISIINVADPVGAQDAMTKAFGTNASNLASGTIPATVMPAHTGDVTSTAGSLALTLANSGVTAGTFKSVTVNAKGLVTAGTNPTTLAGYGITDAVNTSSLGVASGVATLDGTGKLTSSQIPAALVGAVVYQGVWNASTNSPTLVSGTGTKGQYYKVSVAGTTTIDTLNVWNVGDVIIFDGTTWDRLEGDASEVTSVAGRVGAVVLAAADISGLAASATTDTTNASNISSGTLAAARLPAFTGDATSTAGTSALTLANSGVTAGTYNNAATTVSPFTVDAKGRITSVGAAVTIAPPFTSITGSLAATQLPAFTGDVTAPGSSSVLTLANSGVTAGTYTSVTVNAKGLVTAGTSGSVTLANGLQTSGTLTTTTTTANQVLHTFATATFRSAEYMVQIVSGTSYHIAKLLLIHDGTTVLLQETGDMFTGVSLATFDATISAGNLTLTTTPVNAATTFKFVVLNINV